jgi:hypothetical protein
MENIKRITEKQATVSNNGTEIFQRKSDNAIGYLDKDRKFVSLEQNSTWDVPGVAFVNPSSGDDTTAVVGDGNKPYETVTKAADAGADAVFLLPGNYSETINLSSGMTYFSYPGVTFVISLTLG